MEYEFTLKFKLPADLVGQDELIMQKLDEAGCNDALPGFGLRGYLGMDFQREAESATEAMLSAAKDVIQALPGATCIEAAPDFVGLTDIAEIAGVSRQNMRKLFVSHCGAFPSPIHCGSSMVWHLAPVLHFMRERQYQISAATFDVAWTAMQVNLCKEKRFVDASLADQIRTFTGWDECGSESARPLCSPQN